MSNPDTDRQDAPADGNGPAGVADAAAARKSNGREAARPDHLPETGAPSLSPAAGDAAAPDAGSEADSKRPAFGTAGAAAAGAAQSSSRGTALIPALRPDPESAAPPRQPPSPSRSFGLGRLLAVAAIAATTGALAGSLTTAGIAYMVGSQAAGPSYDQVFADGLARIDHQVAVLKGAIDTSARTQSAQVAKIAERMDRAEKAQSDAGTRLAKAGDVLDRVERRLAASSEVTGSVGEARSVPVPPPSPPAIADAKRPAVVEGWVLRDVYNGAAMIQGHGGVLAVLPGDNLPGLGRIEAIKRQDGRWVVVTARGLILPR